MVVITMFLLNFTQTCAMSKSRKRRKYYFKEDLKMGFMCLMILFLSQNVLLILPLLFLCQTLLNSSTIVLVMLMLISFIKYWTIVMFLIALITIFVPPAWLAKCINFLFLLLLLFSLPLFNLFFLIFGSRLCLFLMVLFIILPF